MTTLASSIATAAGTFALCLTVLAAHADGSLIDQFGFLTLGPDRYADGTTVLDGESYAVVWSADGHFDGFFADGTPINSDELILQVLPIAVDGGLRSGIIFQIEETQVDELRGGSYGLFLLDTRVMSPDGTISPTPPANNTLALVNGYGLVIEGLPVVGLQTNAPVRPGLNVGYMRDPVVAAEAAPAPADVPQPSVKSIRMEGDRIVLSVENLSGFVRVQCGETLDAIGTTVTPATATSGDREDVQLVIPMTEADSGFYRVIRN